MAKLPTNPNSPPPETPKATTFRLSLYLRRLDQLDRDGWITVSSRELAEPLGFSDARIRKDLAYFGQFGQAGVGYRVAELRKSLRGVLGVDRTWNAALIGVGNLGRALLNYRGFQERGFKIVALFDRAASVAGKKFNGLEVNLLDQLPTIVRERDVKLALLAVPADSVQAAATAAVAAGVVGLLNFAPTAIVVPSKVKVESVDLALQLEQLAYKVSKQPSERKQSAG